MCGNTLTGSCQIFPYFCSSWLSSIFPDVMMQPPLPLLPFHLKILASNYILSFSYPSPEPSVLSEQLDFRLCAASPIDANDPSFNICLLSFRPIFPTISWTFPFEHDVDPLNSADPIWAHFTSQTFYMYFMFWSVTCKLPNSLSQSCCQPFLLSANHS